MKEIKEELKAINEMYNHNFKRLQVFKANDAKHYYSVAKRIEDLFNKLFIQYRYLSEVKEKDLVINPKKMFAKKKYQSRKNKYETKIMKQTIDTQ